VGSAVNQTARQVGGALGIAVLVVILGTPSGASEALAHFHHLWWFAAGMAASSGLVCCLLGPPGSVQVATDGPEGGAGVDDTGPAELPGTPA
jgi:hypothetical protein